MTVMDEKEETCSHGTEINNPLAHVQIADFIIRGSEKVELCDSIFLALVEIEVFLFFLENV